MQMLEIPCPTGCGRPLTPHAPLCAICWGSLPEALQDGLTRAWERFQKTHKDSDWSLYADVHQQAVEHAREALGITQGASRDG